MRELWNQFSDCVWWLRCDDSLDAYDRNDWFPEFLDDFLDDFLMISGIFDDFWMIFGWFLMIFGWFLDDFWWFLMIFGWFLNLNFSSTTWWTEMEISMSFVNYILSCLVSFTWWTYFNEQCSHLELPQNSYNNKKYELNK